jgi:hypothetical protein
VLFNFPNFPYVGVGVWKGGGVQNTPKKSKAMIVSAAELFVLTLAVQVFIVVHCSSPFPHPNPNVWEIGKIE